MLREQQDPPCETSAEQYQPTSVGTVLGNPAVTLTKGVRRRGQDAVKKAPTAADIAGRGDDFHLDLPGDPLGDTCVYAKDFAALKREGKAPAITYAHIARQAGHPGLAVQYWFFWYFNQFNDLHEGDWEGMQITFEADSPAQALAEGPSEIGLFQHGGGETRRLGRQQGRKEGHPPGRLPRGRLARDFLRRRRLRRERPGRLGRRLRQHVGPAAAPGPAAGAVPTHPPTNGRFKWLTYTGHWGQEEKGFNNGPTGPTTKTQWLEPFAWMEGQRSTSPRLPGGSVVGPQVTGAFCGAVATVSDFINLEAKSRTTAIATIVVIALLIALFVGVTKWRPVALDELRRRRAFGQLVRAARQLYGRHWLALVPIGLTALPIVGGVNVLAFLVAGNRAVDRSTGSPACTSRPQTCSNRSGGRSPRR